MAQRELLQQVLELVCPNVYFQPPTNVQMIYPAIVYNRGRMETEYADNIPYNHVNQYEVTVISRNPDEEIVNEIRQIPMCRHERFYVSDNLNHDFFLLYF